jgi:hypothetical protein
LFGVIIATGVERRRDAEQVTVHDGHDLAPVRGDVAFGQREEPEQQHDIAHGGPAHGGQA